MIFGVTLAVFRLKWQHCGGWNVNEQPQAGAVPPTHSFDLEALPGTSTSGFKIRNPNGYAVITLSVESYGRLRNSDFVFQN